MSQDDTQTSKDGAREEEPKTKGSKDSKDSKGGKGGKGSKDKAKPTAPGFANSNLRVIMGAAALAFFIRIVLVEPFEIDGPSMEPTLQHGDHVIVSKMLYGLFLPWTHEAILTWGTPHRGDIVIVHSPGAHHDFGPADEALQLDIVKRVIGLPGDHVAIRDGVLYLNGEALPETEIGPCDEALQRRVDPRCTEYEQTIDGATFHLSHPANWRELDLDETIEEGYLFVLGDHREQSNDSTELGQIPLNRVKGIALTTYISCQADPDSWFFCSKPRWDRFFMKLH